jgi:hypothetical protein
VRERVYNKSTFGVDVNFINYTTFPFFWFSIFFSSFDALRTGVWRGVKTQWAVGIFPFFHLPTQKNKKTTENQSRSFDLAVGRREGKKNPLDYQFPV